ncbi:BolA family transcriptional regulator [Ruegeria pomeroyi]|uniref:BolA family transcriptional regulator n=1 Tax=Ruegeria alba TaxID=2916756 RepID=A0ABS9NUA7_9RHOB|nr:BolA family protein [Ruegeria alba]MCE8512778.1 BolA family transcriptional regulator [Ruegeria pomeroyi]MCE8516454.1 BolA family transcriptional regulator [Ruegeria pomeroyi]MCE8521475.1 BolA family transcriptional regulator [Ruegeria pomeroyi]MCE8530324.1 BolA family transcriptional regulator [Ruegeria pomeroyi]MCE8545531.1 BolA family transcriptional regulator [Ruegeria pomeroyi]
MTIAEEMRTRLQAAFAPTELEVVDDSESHRGHAGFREGGQSHFNIRIRAAAFAGQSRVARHRAVHQALGDIVPRIHALALDIGT